MESSGLWELASPITDPQAFAQESKIRELKRLLDAYGGKNWKKCKGYATIRLLNSGELLTPELHWYEAHGMIRVVDESGEGYLYPAQMFAPIAVQNTLESQLLAA